MKKLAIFASGSGTNAENIIRFFKDQDEVDIRLIVCNKPEAGVLERANKLSVESICISREGLYDSDDVLRVLKEMEIDVIILAGFLWLVPSRLIHSFPNRIINIHPALLPKYGGKGMYGDRVHQAVYDNKESETGITIHLVNEKYDEGKVLFQARTAIQEGDQPDDIAEKVHALEYKHYPKVIAEYLKSLS